MTRLAWCVLCLLFIEISTSVAPLRAQSGKPPGHVVDIRVGEHFILSPDSAPAGTLTLRVHQTGDALKPWPGDTAKRLGDPTYDFHMVWLVRLDSGKTYADLYNAERDQLPTPWVRVLGGAGFADRPSLSNVTLTATPGMYALVCYVGSARADRSRYHLLRGMIRSFRVTGPLPPTKPLKPSHTIVVRDSVVEVPDSMKAGAHLLAVRNGGARRSDLGIRRMRKGHAVSEALEWRPRMMSPPPFVAVGGVVSVSPGDVLFTTVHLEPGDYLFNDKHVVVRK